MGIHSDANWCEVQIQFTASHFRAEQVDSSTVTFSMFWHIACVPYDIMRSPLWTVSFLSNSLCCDLHTRGPWTIPQHCEGEHRDCNPCRMSSARGGSPKPWGCNASNAMFDSQRPGALRLPSDYPGLPMMRQYRLHLVAPHLSWKQSPHLKCSRETKAPSCNICNQVPKAKAIWNQSNDITRMMQWFNVPNLEVFWGLETGILLGSFWDLFGSLRSG